MVYVLDSVLSQAVEAVLPFFPYTCDVMAPTAGVKDAVGGHAAPTYAAVAEGLKTLFELLRNPQTLTLANKKQVVLTHRMYLQASAITVAITPEYQILVNATDDENAITFTNPKRVEGAFSHLVTLHVSIGGLA